MRYTVNTDIEVEAPTRKAAEALVIKALIRSEKLLVNEEGGDTAFQIYDVRETENLDDDPTKGD